MAFRRSRLSCPGVPFAGVPPLNPMSIWTIQTSPVSLDPLAAPQTSPPAQTHGEEAAPAVPATSPWLPQPQSATRASLGTFPSPPPAPGQFLPPHLFPAPLGALDASLGILGESAPQDGGAQGQDPGSPLSHSVPAVALLPPHALPGAQSQSASLGPMAAAAAAAPGLSLESPSQQQPHPPCPKSAPGPGTLMSGAS
ncbi:CREB-binding protein-like [Pseudonaja textilis]|uniref:CREB-binding protein-like n=1 Tax=Pseudonaja textilis TaxID=8673 RepID=UPI000EA87C70|nr:CREB-binding protein-like [Pseudonaja textilis]